MKKTGLFVILAAIIGFWGCEDDTVETTDLEVIVEYPELYADTHAAGADVELTDMETQSTTTLVTDNSGSVVFTELAPGTYSLSANLTLSPEDAEVQTGIAQEIILAGSKTNIMVSGGNPMEETIELAGGKAGDLVFKEIYYTGSRTPEGGTYFLDQFYEIYNNSTETVYADGLILATVHPPAATRSIEGWSDDEDHVYLSSVWRVPGSGEDHPIEPGESIIISQNGTNHREDPNGNPETPYAGSIADFETFVDREDTRDVDNAGVPNMEMLHHGSMFYFLSSVMGPAIVMFRADDFEALETMPQPGSTSDFEYVQLPVEQIVDGVEAGRNEESIPYKRLPGSVDSGMIWCSGTFVSESIRRKTANIIDGRHILQDTNNTTEDFEVLETPTPGSFD
ncbi:MAG: DUF4876 domain-containing protein [Bacteroidales bacterium]